MSSPTSEQQQKPAVTPRQTMRGHTQFIRGVEHLPGRRHIITCSLDGSLRLWDLKSNAQIGNDWRDEGDEAAVYTIALSRNGNTVASGSADGTVRLWAVKGGKIIAKWTGHTDQVTSLCWSANGERLMSGSCDGTVRVWDVKSGKTVLGPIKTGDVHVYAVMYSPDASKIATGGRDNGIKIWDGKTCELLATLKHDHPVWTLAWTSDGKKVISGSFGPIRIFDTATWEEIAILEGHTRQVRAISLSPNERLLASASRDSTVYLWNLDTNLPVGPSLQHQSVVECAAFSADGRLLVTGCYDQNVYVWDSHTILKEAGLEGLLPISDAAARRKSLMSSDATQRPAQIKNARRLPPTFFNDVHGNIHSPRVQGTHPENHQHNAHTVSSGSPNPIVLLGRLSSLFRRSHPNTNEATELQRRPRRSIFSPHGPRVVTVAAVQDRKPLAVAPRPKRERSSHTQSAGTTTPGAIPAQPQHIPWWAHVVLFLCCASPPPAKQTQQQQQGQSQGQGQASSFQTQPAAVSMPMTPPAPATSTAMPSTVTAQPRPLPLRARLVLFLCCVSPSHH